MPVRFEYSERWISTTALSLVENEDNPFLNMCYDCCVLRCVHVTLASGRCDPPPPLIRSS